MMFFVFVLFSVFSVCFSDDTDALRNTISSLCAVNSVGAYASCCKASLNGQSLTMSNARGCFLFSLTPKEDGQDISYLDFSYTDLRAVGAGTFSSLKHLKSLSLFYNFISSIPEGTFDGLTELTSLSLANNELVSIPPNLFSSLPNLESLEIYQNYITSFPKTLFHPDAKMSWIDTDDNCFNPAGVEYFSSLSSEYSVGRQKHCHSSFVPCHFKLIWQGCTSCKGKKDKSPCLSCNTGYYLNENSCLPCPENACCPRGNDPIVNCSQCNTDQTACLKCVDGFDLSENNCKVN